MKPIAFMQSPTGHHQRVALGIMQTCTLAIVMRLRLYIATPPRPPVWLCPGGMTSRACTSYDPDILLALPRVVVLLTGAHEAPCHH